MVSKEQYFKCRAKVNFIVYPRDIIRPGEWSVFKADIIENLEGPEITGSFVFTGCVPTLRIGSTYTIAAKTHIDPKYGLQGKIISINTGMNLNTPIEKRLFLEKVLTETQVNSLYENLQDPFEAIKNGDIETLTQVKGIGSKTAQKMIEGYENNKDNSRAYVELDNLGLNKNMIDKLVERYRSPDILVEKIRENPYILISEVSGIGWQKADMIALKTGITTNSPFRIQGYIRYFLTKAAEHGHSWVTTKEVISGITEDLKFSQEDLKRVGEVFHQMYDKKQLCWNKDKTHIGLTKYYKLESDISNHLKRLINSDREFNCENFNEVISSLERKQDWEFTEEQLNAIKQTIENNVIIITGYGGTGKSSVVSGVLEILKDYPFNQCALSGRAASRLSELTNAEGHTIHRLLEYDMASNKFLRNENNPLDTDIIVLDEISMVGAELFLDLIKAIPTGSKLIMIGDDGQLESIGLCNIFKDMLSSNTIPVVRLTKIHRQAQKSAIITESIKVRSAKQLIDPNWVGNEIRGELKDLELDIFNDAILTKSHIVEYYKKFYDEFKSARDLQVVVPMKHRGEISTYELNNELQKIANPNYQEKDNIVVYNENNNPYTLAVDDKVIITHNHYRTRTVDGEKCPVFNGNQGIIKSVDKATKTVIVDFNQWGEIVIKSKDKQSIELGYALTCHKLQGSEAKYVIIGLDYSGMMLLTREWLYTAITRAQKYCVVCAETKALNYCISHSNIPYKRTYLKHFLNHEDKANVG